MQNHINKRKCKTYSPYIFSSLELILIVQISYFSYTLFSELVIAKLFIVLFSLYFLSSVWGRFLKVIRRCELKKNQFFVSKNHLYA